MRIALALAAFLLIWGCTKPPAYKPVATKLPAPKPSRIFLDVDVRENAAEGAADTTIQWKPRSGKCEISIVAKSLADQAMNHLDILDEQDHPIGQLNFITRQDDKWLVAGTTVKSSGELHFRLPHALEGDLVSSMIMEDLTDSDWEKFKKRGAGECVLVETGPGKVASPMVRALGQKVELSWAASPGANSGSIKLIGDATELGQEAMNEFAGHIKAKNSGSIQFDITGKPAKRQFKLKFS